MANEPSTTNSGVATPMKAKDFLKSPAVQKTIADTLGKKAGQFTTSVLSLIGNDDLLAQADPGSLFTACLTAASLDLPINKNLGFAHIIGYKNNKKKNADGQFGLVEAQFQIGAKGLKQLAMRTGEYKFINSSDVREGELVKYDRLSGEIEFKWVEDTDIRNSLDVIGFVSFFELHNGFRSTVYMTVAEVNAHAKRYSQSFKSGYGPWKDNYEAMAAKTVMKKNIGNNGPMSTELQRAVDVDQSVIHEDGKIDYIDGETGGANVPQEIIDAIKTAQDNNEIGEILESLDVETRKAAGPYVRDRMTELKNASDDK